MSRFTAPKPLAFLGLMVLTSLSLISSGCDVRLKPIAHSHPATTTSTTTTTEVEISPIAQCTVPVASWVMYVERGIRNNDGTASDVYFYLGYQNPLSQWIVTEAANDIRNSYNYGQSNAVVTMAQAVRAECDSLGDPSVQFAPA